MIYRMWNSEETFDQLYTSPVPVDILYEGAVCIKVEVATKDETAFKEHMKMVNSGIVED
jgi:hypothetical protein